MHREETVEDVTKIDSADHAARRAKWDVRYVRLAKHISDWSKDPNAKVGAVVSNSSLGRVVGLGINGFPMNIEDDKTRLSDKKLKLNMVLHAEQNAILSSGRDSSGGNIYVYGKPVCNHCAALIIQAGIDRVIAARPKPESENESDWDIKGRLALEMFSEANVRFTEIDEAWLGD
ncbi:Cytidine and deoxycytidylate deaminase zinc-binding region [compost metagenome]|uniref:deoxycytidylate deaminase n=1 Tax=Brevundimonas diminuta TaxID=293 RepID=UPI000FABABF8